MRGQIRESAWSASCLPRCPSQRRRRTEGHNRRQSCSTNGTRPMVRRRLADESHCLYDHRLDQAVAAKRRGQLTAPAVQLLPASKRAAWARAARRCAPPATGATARGARSRSAPGRSGMLTSRWRFAATGHQACDGPASSDIEVSQEVWRSMRTSHWATGGEP
jgi:hypothetical protein